MVLFSNNEVIVREFERNCANDSTGNENARSIARSRADLRAIDLAFSFPTLPFALYCSSSRTIASFHADPREIA